MSNAVVYKVGYVDPDCDETSEGGRHYTGDCLRLEVYERHEGERTGYGCVDRIDFDLHDGGDGIREMLEYLSDWDADVRAERLGIVHPCGRCGMAEGAGAAGLCLKCDELADAVAEREVAR
jgi:hypothetical protein